MAKQRTSILVTGASGFIGGYFLETVKEQFQVYALAHQSPKNVLHLNHPNIKWLHADIGDQASLKEAMAIIRQRGGVDFILHLAGYYDYNYDEHPEYERTNVRGTRNMLEEAKTLNIQRFIFASSVAACRFPKKGERITERTPADAVFAYARSKRQGEELLRENSKHFPCTAVRFAAVFSDWCEFGPLYVFLNTWLTRNWKSRILAGKGKSAITYIHVNCLTDLLLRVIHRSAQLPDFDVYCASSEFPVSHEELFALATKFYFGEKKRPIHLPKIMALTGILLLDFFGRIIRNRPFERPWMLRYVNKQLWVDASYTQLSLDWRPSNRYIIQRRLLFMIEHLKSYPYEWHIRNTKVLKRLSIHPNYKIFKALQELQNKIIERILDHVLDVRHRDIFKNYNKINVETLRKDAVTIYQLLCVAVRTQDRMAMLSYAKEIADIRSRQKFPSEEVVEAITVIGKIVQEELLKHPSLQDMEGKIYDEVNLTFQLMKDEIEGAFEQIERDRPETVER